MVNNSTCINHCDLVNHCDPGPDPALARAGHSGLAAFFPARVLAVSAAHAELAWQAACDPDAVPVLEYPAGWNLSFQVLAVAEDGQAALPDNIGALPGHADETDSAAVAAFAVAALVVGSAHVNTAADRSAAGRAPEQRCGSICPSRFYAAPNHGPSDLPNVATHQPATR